MRFKFFDSRPLSSADLSSLDGLIHSVDDADDDNDVDDDDDDNDAVELKFLNTLFDQLLFCR